MWIFWAFMAALSAALVIIFTKAGLEKIDSSLAFAVQAIFILVITWALITYQGTFNQLKQLDTKTWGFLVAAGIFTTLSTLFSYKALSLGPASYVVTIERMSLLFTIVLAVIFLKEKLSWQLVLGAGLMLAGALLIGLTQKS